MSIFGQHADKIAEQILTRSKKGLKYRIRRTFRLTHAQMRERGIDAWIDAMLAPQVVEWHQLLEGASYNPGHD